MGKHDIIAISVCVLIAGCVSSETSLRIDEKKYAGYLVDRNSKARELDLGIGIQLLNGQMYMVKRDASYISTPYGFYRDRVRCTLGELETRVREEVARCGVIDCSFIPVTVWAIGSARFGQVASIFDMFNGMGFNVLGFFSVNDRPPIHKTDTLDLPSIQNGDSLDVYTRYSNCVYIKIHSGGEIVVDDTLVLESDDATEDGTKLRRYVRDHFSNLYDNYERWRELVCLIFADRNAHVEHVDHAATAANQVGFSHVALVGVGNAGHRYIWFTTPAPNGIYWELGD